MKKILQELLRMFFCLFLMTLSDCNGNNTPANETINAINLKRGEVILCGPPDKQFGTVEFETSCSEKVKKDFDLALALLHSFEYDEAEKVFEKLLMKSRNVRWLTGV